MANANCAMCGDSVPESQLLFSDEGRICGTCELELGDREAESNAHWIAAVGGPLFAFTALVLMLTGFVPVIGLFTGILAPMSALVAVGFGVRAFLAAGDAEDGMRTLLVLCGGLAVPSGLGVFVLSLILMVLQLVALGSY